MATLLTMAAGRSGPTTTKTSAAWRHDLQALAAVRTFYEEEHGWPVSVEPGAGRVTVTTGGVLDALMMPSALGEAVANALIEVMRPQPAFVGGGWWTLLTQPRPAGVVLPKDLVRARVRMIPEGAPVRLPLHRAGWVLPPRADRGLPPHSVVIGLARRVRAAVAP